MHRVILRVLVSIWLACAGLALTSSVAAAATPTVSLSTTDLHFGSVYLGDDASIDVVVTNVGTAPITPHVAGGAPLDADNFGGSQDCAGVTLDPGDTCTFTYTFNPMTAGSHTSSTSITIKVLDDSATYPISLDGTGLDPITVAPTDLHFGSVYLGDNASIDVVVTNVGTAPIAPRFGGGAPLDADNFGGSQDCAGVTLDPGDTCTFTYTFNPMTAGSHTSSTSFTIKVLGDSVTYPISLDGTGVVPPTTTSTTTTSTTTSTVPTTMSPTSTTAPTATTSPATTPTTGGSTTTTVTSDTTATTTPTSGPESTTAAPDTTSSSTAPGGGVSGTGSTNGIGAVARTGTTTSTLPRTGTDTRGPAVVGLVLLVTGFALAVGSARRRRTA